MSLHLSQLNVVMAHRNYFRGIICESSNWQHIERLKIAILGANWQLWRLERMAKCSYFILSKQNIKFYWFVMKIKKFVLPISFFLLLNNKYFGVFVLNGYLSASSFHWAHLILVAHLVIFMVLVSTNSLLQILRQIQVNVKLVLSLMKLYFTK